jgi:4-diphosphocytidyl-2-C-methyl-D-erythritol kinase
MGGGSSDAAAALRLAARAAGRPDDPRLATLAARLGADVPSLLDPSLALMTGAGEHLAPVRERSPYGMVLVPAHAQLSTAEVYAEADRRGGLRSAAKLAGLAERLTEVLEVSAELPPTELLVNDLEPAARALCPDIDRVLEVVRAAGAAHAIVTGSGPTVVGLFPGVEGPALAAVAAAELAGSHPAAAAAAPLPPGFLDA